MDEQEYRCGTCGSASLVIRAVAPGSEDHHYCFMMYCGNGHEIVPTGAEFTVHVYAS